MVNLLLSWGSEFDALLSRWRAMPPGEERDDICEVLNEKAEVIRLAPCASLAELVVKARGVAWTCNLDPSPAEDDDFLGYVLAGFITEVERVAGAPPEPPGGE